MICDECGCDAVEPTEIEGFAIGECTLCGHLHGDLDEIGRIDELREGRSLGYGPEIYPLVKTVGMITGYKVVAAGGGFPDKGAPPFVHFKIHGPKCRALLERLMGSVAMANRQMDIPWLIEVSLVRGLTFTLRPRFQRPPDAIEPAVVRASRAGVQAITRQLRRDMNLAWWHELADDD